MNNDFLVVKRINIDPSNLKTEEDKLQIVSFKIEVMDKYRNDPTYNIKLDNDVGILNSPHDGWSLQIDINYTGGYVNAWLYNLGDLPDSEQEHFASYNIYPQQLSETAHRKWLKNIP